MTGPIIAALLIIAMLVARAYPLSRARQLRIRELLQKRQAAGIASSD